MHGIDEKQDPIEGIKNKKFVRGRNPASFSKVYATNVIVDTTDVDIRLSLMNEVIEGEKEKIAVCDVIAILSPQAAVLLLDQLTEAVKKFENNGEIIVSNSRKELIKALKSTNDTSSE